MISSQTSLLLQEMRTPPAGVFAPHVFRGQGVAAHPDAPFGVRRAAGIATLFSAPRPHLYRGDLIAGSIRPL